MAGCKYHIYLELHDPKSPLGINPPLPAWQRIANALTELFDILRQNRSDLVHYGSLQHDIYLLPEHLVKRAEDREERMLSEALLPAGPKPVAEELAQQHADPAGDTLPHVVAGLDDRTRCEDS
jgi:hypothetical protein